MPFNKDLYEPKTNIMKSFSPLQFLFISLFLTFSISAQDCQVQFKLTLRNINGGFYTNTPVKLTSERGESFEAVSNELGEANFDLPCQTLFTAQIPNYTRKLEITTPQYDGSRFTKTIGYEPNMAEKDKSFAMTSSEKADLDKYIAKYPDTTFIKNSIMPRPSNSDYFAQFRLNIKDLDSGPLAGEEVTMTGEKRNISFKGSTNSSGDILFYLPKGDTYTINFKYNKNYKKEEIQYSIGNSEGNLKLSYIGSKEILRRKKIEEERIREEEERLKREHEEFVAWCKKEKISEEEGYRIRLLGTSDSEDTVVSAVLNRKHWSEKLIMCDLTGSMDPYSNQLAVWYQLNYKKEKNLQFVFFNDGDDKDDSEKIIGNTGGIYYQPSKGMDSLVYLMSKVRANGNGGDCPENNMEALISGVKKASPYKELVMIVDNNAPVKDISLLEKFNIPVHIIACGVVDCIHEDYLNIAWKTKGSVHTIEEDIEKIATMSEGQTIKIGGIEYKIMGGSFVRITKS